MSLDIYLEAMRPTDVFESNLTHNLGDMANAAGIYDLLWRPNEIGIRTAADVIEPLREGLRVLYANPEKFRAFDAPNKWGTYEQFVPILEEYLAACVENPDALVRVSR